MAGALLARRGRIALGVDSRFGANALLPRTALASWAGPEAARAQDAAGTPSARGPGAGGSATGRSSAEIGQDPGAGASDPSGRDELARLRRLAEMASEPERAAEGGDGSGSSGAAPTAPLPGVGAGAAWARGARRALPSAAETARMLGRGEAGAPALRGAVEPVPKPKLPPPPSLDWREVLRLAREMDGPAPADLSTLTDSYARRHTYLRISLTERCNLRCTYCMPEDGVELSPREELLTTPEILRIARVFAECGVRKVRLTGGEPTLRKDLVEIVRGLRALPNVSTVGITSNGIVLARRLAELREAGLTHVNLSLDTLQPGRFERLSRRRGHERVLDSLRRALDLGFSPVKVNCVVQRGVNDDEAADFARLALDRPVNVRFIEYMPFDEVEWRERKMVGYAELKARIEGELGPLVRLPDPPNEVARNYRLSSSRGAAGGSPPAAATADASPPPVAAAAGDTGTVSFVASMTAPFCSGCDRVRLMADGALKVCLFGASEVSLRDALRAGCSDEDLRVLIRAALGRKHAAHAGMRQLAATKNRAMVKIGG